MSEFSDVIYLILTPQGKNTSILGDTFSLSSIFLFNNFYDNEGFLPAEKVTCGMTDILVNALSAHSPTKCMLGESKLAIILFLNILKFLVPSTVRQVLSYNSFH